MIAERDKVRALGLLLSSERLRRATDLALMPFRVTGRTTWSTLKTEMRSGWRAASKAWTIFSTSSIEDLKLNLCSLKQINRERLAPAEPLAPDVLRA